MSPVVAVPVLRRRGYVYVAGGGCASVVALSRCVGKCRKCGWLSGQTYIYAAPHKCEFHKDTVEYLGFILSPDGLCMAEDKVKTILDWPEPRKVKDIQSFLEFCNFYR
jgi:hypothetical protein